MTPLRSAARCLLLASLILAASGQPVPDATPAAFSTATDNFSTATPAPTTGYTESLTSTPTDTFSSGTPAATTGYTESLTTIGYTEPLTTVVQPMTTGSTEPLGGSGVDPRTIRVPAPVPDRAPPPPPGVLSKPVALGGSRSDGGDGLALPSRDGFEDLYNVLDPRAANDLKAELANASPKAEAAAIADLDEGDVGGAVAGLRRSGLDIPDEVVDAAAAVPVAPGGSRGSNGGNGLALPSRDGFEDLYNVLDPRVASDLKAELVNASPKAEAAANTALDEGDVGGAVAGLRRSGLDIPDEVVEASAAVPVALPSRKGFKDLFSLLDPRVATDLKAELANASPKAEAAAVAALDKGDVEGAVAGLKRSGLDIPDEVVDAAAAVPGAATDEENGDDETVGEDDDNSCFPAAATAERPDGTRARMDDLRVGDRVRVSAGTHDDAFSEVFLFTHANPFYESGRFVRVSAGGRALTAAPGHFVYKVRGGGGRAAVAVESLRAGESVLLDGEEVVVEKVDRVHEKGLYNPQTMHGDVVVDGFLATTYTRAVVPEVAHALLAPARAAYLATGMDLSAVFEVCAGYVR